jgi:hypothetical protein
MQKIKKIVEVIWQHVFWVWELIPILLLVEVWSLTRVVIILLTVAMIVVKDFWDSSMLYQMITDLFSDHM